MSITVRRTTALSVSPLVAATLEQRVAARESMPITAHTDIGIPQDFDAARRVTAMAAVLQTGGVTLEQFERYTPDQKKDYLARHPDMGYVKAKKKSAPAAPAKSAPVAPPADNKVPAKTAEAKKAKVVPEEPVAAVPKAKSVNPKDGA